MTSISAQVSKSNMGGISPSSWVAVSASAANLTGGTIDFTVLPTVEIAGVELLVRPFLP